MISQRAQLTGSGNGIGSINNYRTRRGNSSSRLFYAGKVVQLHDDVINWAVHVHCVASTNNKVPILHAHNHSPHSE